jgi:uncharacterized protein (DUF433 family)
MATEVQLQWAVNGECRAMIERIKYEYLKPKPGSNYQQLFVNGRIRAEVLYRRTIGPDPLSPEEVAEDYDLPLAAVQEAIEYCRENQDLLDADRAREDDSIRDRELDKWPYAPRGSESGA